MDYALRALVFTSDDAVAGLVCQVLQEIGAEADHCPDPVAAVGRAASEPFQILIADWDEQPNAEFLLKAARGQKAGQRPLALAIVSDEAGIPKALQAGANSILRKPVVAKQVKDTLQTARSLLKARQDASSAAASSVAGISSRDSSQPSSLPPSIAGSAKESHLRAGDFLQSGGTAPGAHFDTESDMQKSLEQSAVAELDPLKELEPMAASVAASQAEPAATLPSANEPRGLQWYLNQRAATPSPSPAQTPGPPPPARPELLGYDQIANPEPPVTPENEELSPAARKWREAASGKEHSHGLKQQTTETELFAHIEGGSSEPKERSPRQFRLGKGPVLAAAVLAAGAIAAAPQAPWHPQARKLWARAGRTVHAWLNPQIITPAQAPPTHENFGRAGDEYKLPVAENIPDATTDPSQIRVVPVIDPTAKKPENAGTNGNPTGDAASASSTDPQSAGQASGAQPPGAQVQNPSPQSASSPSAASIGSANPAPSATTPSQSPSIPASISAGAVPGASGSSARPVSVDFSQIASPNATNSVTSKWNPPVVVRSGGSSASIPSSLKSQLAPAVPDQSGNKAAETALPSIEPVGVPEAAERALLASQSAIPYPSSAQGQKGTVALQVLIGRDGTVQDAKFLQGSLAFARVAIDGVKQWRFKPYIMNGRPVSVQTQVTLSFNPGQ